MRPPDDHLRLMLQAATPRSLEGAASYLFSARVSYRMGMIGALLFAVPFVVITATGPNSLFDIFTVMLNIGLFWVLPPILFLRHRMRYINRLWREGRVVQGTLKSAHVLPLKNGNRGGAGRFVVSFTTAGGQERSAIFLADSSDFVPGQPPMIVTHDDIPHRAGLIGAANFSSVVRSNGPLPPQESPPLGRPSFIVMRGGARVRAIACGFFTP